MNNAQELKLRTDEEDLNNVTCYGNVMAERESTNTYAGARKHVQTQRNLVTRKGIKHSVRNNK